MVEELGNVEVGLGVGRGQGGLAGEVSAGDGAAPGAELRRGGGGLVHRGVLGLAVEGEGAGPELALTQQRLGPRVLGGLAAEMSGLGAASLPKIVNCRDKKVHLLI